MVAASGEEVLALYTLSPTKLERTRTMSRLRLPVGMPDISLPRGSGGVAKQATPASARGRAGAGAHLDAAGHGGGGSDGGGASASAPPPSGLRSPKQFPGALPGHSPPTWRKPGHPPPTAPYGTAADDQQLSLSGAAGGGSDPLPYSARPKSSSVGSSSSVSGGGLSPHPHPAGVVSIINHVLDAQAYPVQAGYQGARQQTSRCSFRTARTVQQPLGFPPRTPPPAAPQHNSATSGSPPLAAHLQPGSHRHTVHAAATPPGLAVTGQGRRQALMHRPLPHQHRHPPTEAWQESPPELAATEREGGQPAPVEASNSEGGVPLPHLPNPSARRKSGDTWAAAAGGGGGGPPTPPPRVSTPKLQQTGGCTPEPLAPGPAPASPGCSGTYVFRHTGRSALLAAAEVGLISINSLPMPPEELLAAAEGDAGSEGSSRHYQPHGPPADDSAPGSLAWRLVGRYCRRRVLSGAFCSWHAMVGDLRARRDAAERVRRQGEINLMALAFTSWWARIWRRRQRRTILMRAGRRRLRAYFAAWREQSTAQADGYRLWLLEQVQAVCPAALGEEVVGLIAVLQQRHEAFLAREEARLKEEEGVDGGGEARRTGGEGEGEGEGEVAAGLEEAVGDDDLWTAVAKKVAGSRRGGDAEAGPEGGEQAVAEEGEGELDQREQEAEQQAEEEAAVEQPHEPGAGGQLEEEEEEEEWATAASRSGSGEGQEEVEVDASPGAGEEEDGSAGAATGPAAGWEADAQQTGVAAEEAAAEEPLSAEAEEAQGLNAQAEVAAELGAEAEPGGEAGSGTQPEPAPGDDEAQAQEFMAPDVDAVVPEPEAAEAEGEDEAAAGKEAAAGAGAGAEEAEGSPTEANDGAEAQADVEGVAEAVEGVVAEAEAEAAKGAVPNADEEVEEAQAEAAVENPAGSGAREGGGEGDAAPPEEVTAEEGVTGEAMDRGEASVGHWHGRPAVDEPVLYGETVYEEEGDEASSGSLEFASAANA